MGSLTVARTPASNVAAQPQVPLDALLFPLDELVLRTGSLRQTLTHRAVRIRQLHQIYMLASRTSLQDRELIRLPTWF